MTNRQLLVEYLPFIVEPDFVNESLKHNNGRLVVRGPLQRADIQNQNGRVYPKSILEREAKKYMNLVKERRALGELDHADSSIINLKNVSHNITKLWWEGNDVMGELEVLSTPSGNILKELFKNGIRVGISSRGLGSVRPINEDGDDGAVEVQEDFELLCWDVVSSPSTQGAFVRPITEGVNRSMATGEVCGKWCKAQDLMREIIVEIRK